MEGISEDMLTENAHPAQICCVFSLWGTKFVGIIICFHNYSYTKCTNVKLLPPRLHYRQPQHLTTNWLPFANTIHLQSSLPRDALQKCRVIFFLLKMQPRPRHLKDLLTINRHCQSKMKSRFWFQNLMFQTLPYMLIY